MRKKTPRFEKDLDGKIRRRIKIKPDHSLAFSFALFGIVGWSIVTPTILATWLGRWLDVVYDTGMTFTLPFIVLGITIGSLNAWKFVEKEIERSS